MEIDHIGVISLVVSLGGLFMTFLTFIESKSTKHAVLSNKTRKAYESYKKFIIPKLEKTCEEITQGSNKPEFRSELIAMIGQMEGFKEHLNKTTKAALNELESIFDPKRKSDIDVTLTLFGISQKVTLPERPPISDQSLTDALSRLIGGLKQPAPKLFD